MAVPASLVEIEQTIVHIPHSRAALCVAELRELHESFTTEHVRLEMLSEASQAVGLHSMKSKHVASVILETHQSAISHTNTLNIIKSQTTSIAFPGVPIIIWHTGLWVDFPRAASSPNPLSPSKSNNNINDFQVPSTSAFILRASNSLTSNNGKAQLRPS